MADVTGQLYEGFVRFIVENLIENEFKKRKLEIHFEKHFPAECKNNVTICRHANDCLKVSKEKKLAYGPWYDPDFIITEDSKPVACIHVTHWTSPSDSPRKFWRTIEDHFQFKTFFGKSFLSLNILFEGLSKTSDPIYVKKVQNKLDLHGWKPAVGTAFVDSFDGSLIFPKDYEPFALFIEKSKKQNAHNVKLRYIAQKDIWNSILNEDSRESKQIRMAIRLVEKLLLSKSDDRFGDAVIHHLQNKCFKGRKEIKEIRQTSTPYRQGIQHAFILFEACKSFIANNEQAKIFFKKLMSEGSRLPKNKILKEIDELSNCNSSDIVDSISCIPVRIDKSKTETLLNSNAGVGKMSYSNALGSLSDILIALDPVKKEEFLETLIKLFENYTKQTGVNDAISDLLDRNRVVKKIQYVKKEIFSKFDRDGFINTVLRESIKPGYIPPHQCYIPGETNWFIEVILSLGNIKRKQDIVSHLSECFTRQTGEDLRHYSFQGNYDQLVNHLFQGIDLSIYFRKSAKINVDEFLKIAWTIIADLTWNKVSTVSRREIDLYAQDYRYKKSMRIISQSDLDPISYLIKKKLPELTEAKSLHGCYSELCSANGWAKNALVTEVLGVDKKNKRIIWSQAVFGKKHIADKTRELCARIRNINIKYSSELFIPNSDDEYLHELIVDGDWPASNKINLLEAGFSSIIELAEL